jgi:hypothetical protein
MAFQGNFNTALEMVRDGFLPKQTDEDLDRIHEVLRRYQAAVSNPETKPAIEAVENEKMRRQKERHHLAEKSLTEQAILKGDNAHHETMQKLGEMEKLIERLAHARPIDWAVFVAAVLAVIAALLQLLKH